MLFGLIIGVPLLVLKGLIKKSVYQIKKLSGCLER